VSEVPDATGPGLGARVDAVLFDLDDTLFDQSHFFAGAFAAAAAECGSAAAPRVAAELAAVTRERTSGGSGIFEEALRRAGLAPDPERLRRMAEAYLAHRPERLSPYEGVEAMLAALAARWPLGLVSDGPAATQAAKLAALGIGHYFTAVVFSDALGGAAARKPSPVPFLAALDELRVAPERAVYVGDNPRRDFVGARALGLLTVRVLTGEYRDARAEPGHGADFTTAPVVDLLERLR
jgi:putative hydrolase of the HAD superfamily